MATYRVAFSEQSGLGEREIEAEEITEGDQTIHFYDENGERVAIVAKENLGFVQRED